MKEKIAYLRGLMDGMQLPDDNNGKLLRAIADCLDAIADEVETESARGDVIEEELDLMGDEIEEIEDVLEELLDEEDEDEEEDEEDGQISFEDLMFDHPEGHCCGGHHPHHGPCGRHHHGPCGHHHHGPFFEGGFFGGDEDEENDWLDDFNYFTCPNCGEIVPLDDDALEQQSNPICPKCNSPLFTEEECKKEDGEE